MNDRMTELYAKACLDARDIHPTDVPAFIACMAENFAELMIIEFSDVVKQTANEITTAGFKGDVTQDEVLLCVNGALRVLDNIRKRFGVE